MSLVQKAVAAALVATAATSAHAIDISSYATNNSSSLVANVYVSGSTAVNLVLWESAAHTGTGALCDATKGAIDVYSDAADKANPHAQILIYCYASAAVIAQKGWTSPNTQIALFKESELGSQNGSIPLISNATGGSGSNSLSFINVASLSDSNCCAAAAGTMAGTQPYNFHGSCTFSLTVPHVNITGGISDVEAPLVGANRSQVSKYLTATPGLAVVWAVPVNVSFYRALQAGQGLSGNGAAGVPSLSHSQLAAIYSEQLYDASLIVNSSGASVLPSGTVIGICRREFGSGTEASAELFWLGEGCGSSDLGIPGADDANVFEETSTGNIAGCLEAMDTGANITDADGGPFPSGGPGRPGIGIISSENGASTFTISGSSGVGVVAVDGALPTLENVVNGTYPFFGEDVLYNITSASLYSGSPSAVWNQVKASIGTPAFLADNNKSYVNYWGQSGDLSPPSIYGVPSTIPATNASVVASPINALTKSSSGSPNNCDPAEIYSGAKTPTYNTNNN